MDTTLSLETILHMLKGLSPSSRLWLAEHLVEADETDRAIERRSDEELMQKLHSLRYDGEMTAEEMKKALHESRSFGLRDIKYSNYGE